MTNRTASRSEPPNSPSSFLTHATVRISGSHAGDVGVRAARTESATVSMAWGGIGMVFTSADAAQGVLEGFAAARAQMVRLDNHPPVTPNTVPVEEVCRQTVAMTWVRRPGYAVLTQDAYSPALRRTVYWVELVMGPVTWAIMDHTSYHSAIATLQRAHRTAVGVCLDGHRFRADPTRDDYTPPGVDDDPAATPAPRARRR